MDIRNEVKEPRHIGILPVPGFALMSYSGVVEPLRAANLLSQRTLYEVVHYSKDGSPVQSSGAAQVPGEARIAETRPLDLLLVVAGGDPLSYRDGDVFAWLRHLSRRGVGLGGVSGGPVILARAGLMDGRRMTVHWEHAESLSDMSHTLLVERSLYVIDRDRMTCAGGTAPMDMIHAMIAEDHGRAFARQVSDWFLHTEVRPAGGAQRAGLVERLGTRSGPLLEAVAAMESHVSDPLSLRDLSLVAGVSVRQLNRLCVACLGVSTMEYYRNHRLDVAHGLLQTAPIDLTEIALATGFANSSHFSRRFRARFGCAPSQVRRRLE